MAQQIASGGISLVGIPHSEFRRTVYLAAGITKADEGKPVTLDTTADNTFKLAGDGDVVEPEVIEKGKKDEEEADEK